MYFPSGYSNRRKPFFMLGRFPIHITQLIFVALIVGLLCTIFLGAARVIDNTACAITEAYVMKWWTPFSYVWFTIPNFWNIVGLIFFVIYGARLEAELERAWYAGLMIYLWLLPPLLMYAASALGIGFLSGPQICGTSLFLAYCFMHPQHLAWGVIPMKWFGLMIMIAILGHGTAFRLWPNVLAEGFTWLGMYGILRYLGHTREWHLLADVGFTWERSSSPSRINSRPRSKQGPKLKPRTVIDLKNSSALDAILDKINSEGIHSLTEKEKAILKNTSDEFAE